MMKTIAICMLGSVFAGSVTAQTDGRVDALVTAIEYAMAEDPGTRRDRLVLDTLRIAESQVGRSELVAELAARLGARPGLIEDHCFRIPVDPSERAPLRRMEVRNASAVIAARFLDLAPDTAVIRVTVWSGSGHHTGGTYQLKMRRDGGEWRVAEHLTTAAAGCIPRR